MLGQTYIRGLLGLKQPKPMTDPKGREYATFNRRLMAISIDSVVLLLFAPLVEIALYYIYGPPPDLSALQATIMAQSDQESAARVMRETLTETRLGERLAINLTMQVVFFFIYMGTCWVYFSSTPGKLLLRTRIVDAQTGEPMSIGQICDRLLGYMVSSMPVLLGFFWIGFDRRKRGWHDFIAKTVVVVEPGGVPWRVRQGAPKSTPQSADPSDSPAPAAGE